MKGSDSPVLPESAADSGLLYWDSSAILSVLLEDERSDLASQWLQADFVHLASTLAWAEVQAVIARLRRAGELSEEAAAQAVSHFEQGPWGLLLASPGKDHIRALAPRWRLRGADLWHLALARTLQEILPGVRFVTFDLRLMEAAAGEGLLWPSSS